MKHNYLTLLAAAAALGASAQSEVATFEDLTLESESYWAGDTNGDSWYWGYGYSQDFVSGGYSFRNCAIPSWYSWVGFAYSNMTSTDFADYTVDQFKSCVGHGVDGSATYGVAYPDGTMWGEDFPITVLNGPAVVPGFYITNNAWTVDMILNGDYSSGSFAVGNYFKLTIHALNADGEETASRDFCLADYRFENAEDRYYINDWSYVDLSQLGEASAFTFTFDGNQENNYGLSTPMYFCLDNFGAEGTENVRAEGTYTGSSSIASVAVDANEDAAIYNIQGIRVNDTTRPGLYIINGKKVLVK